MPTDDDRREVARRLRETGEELGSAALLWYHIAKALGVRTATDGKTACDMLADLIEPCCDRDALLALADDIFEDATGLAFISQLEENEELQDLQSTMAKALMDYARRIREALGVES